MGKKIDQQKYPKSCLKLHNIREPSGSPIFIFKRWSCLSGGAHHHVRPGHRHRQQPQAVVGRKEGKNENYQKNRYI